MAKKPSVIALAASLAIAGSATAAPEKIRIGWILTPAELTPYMFQKEGVATHNGTSYTLEPVHFQGSIMEVAAVEAGELDIAAFGSTTFAVAVENAGLKDLRIIADEVQDGVPGWSGPEFRVLKDGPINTIEDLKGKVLVTNGMGGATDMAIKLTMLAHGMQGRDYTLIEAAMPNMNALLLERKADLVTAVHPFQDEPNFAAKSRILFKTADALGRFELSFWTARTAYIAQHRAVLVDLIEDYVRLRRWYLDPAHRDEAVAIVVNFTKRPRATYESWLFVPGMSYYQDPDARPDIDAVTRNVRAQHQLGLVKADLEGKDFSDLSLLDEAIARIK